MFHKLKQIFEKYRAPEGKDTQGPALLMTPPCQPGPAQADFCQDEYGDFPYRKAAFRMIAVKQGDHDYHVYIANGQKRLLLAAFTPYEEAEKMIARFQDNLGLAPREPGRESALKSALKSAPAPK